MNRIRREPTLILQAVSAVLAILVTFNLHGLSSEQAALIVAAISAVFGVVNAVAVRPVAPAAFTGLVGAAAALLTGYGLNVSPELVASVSAAAVTVLGLLTRQQVTPAAVNADGSFGVSSL
jgi:hypothetical protein